MHIYKRTLKKQRKIYDKYISFEEKLCITKSVNTNDKKTNVKMFSIL